MRRALLALILIAAAGCGSGNVPAAVTGPPTTTTVAETAATSLATTTTVPGITTAPSTTTTVAAVETWSIAVVGDFGDGGQAEGQVASAIAAWVGDHPDTRALVTTGDNFYTSDVAAAWEAPYGWVAAAGLAVWAVPGNHDIESAGQWLASVSAFGAFPHWGTHEAGGVTFVMLDSNQVGSAEQREWLEQSVADLTGKPWIAVFHHPWYSCGKHGSNAGVAENWGDLLSGAALVLNGHDHDYQRFETERGWSVVTGGGGKALYAVAGCPSGTELPVVAAEAFHFLGIVGDATGLVVEAIGVDGTVIDSFRVDIGS
jgi:hypothetical protein